MAWLINLAFGDSGKNLFTGSAGAVIDHFGAILFISVVLSMTPVVAVYWLFCQLTAGRTSIRRTLRRAADPVGIGTMAGFLLAALVVLFHISVPRSTFKQATTPGIDLLVNLSVAGAVVGFGVGHLCVVDQASKAFGNRIMGWILGPVLCVSMAIVTSLVINPRAVAASLISSYTEGVTVAPGVIDGSEPMDWHLVLLTYQDSLLSQLPDRSQFVGIFSATILLFSLCAPVRWNLTNRLARSRRVHDLVIDRHVSAAVIGGWLGVSRTYVLERLVGKHRFTPRDLARIAPRLGCSFRFVYGGPRKGPR